MGILPLLGESNPAQEVVHWWNWVLLGVLILALLILDFKGHIRKAHEPGIKEAAVWSGIYMAIAVLFGLLVWMQWDLNLAAQYWAGWITEWSLSLDNLFVFIIILSGFKVPRRHQQKVIMLGIIISMVLRLAFILIGSALINRFAWIFYLFGAFLIYTAISQAREGITSEQEQSSDEYQENRFTSIVRRILPITEGFVEGRMLYRHRGKTYFTPLFLVIVAIGSADLMFAFDSIPAIFGLTKHPFIVFSATAFSLMGLRQLFFLVDGLLERLAFLHYGLALILGFIGVKLIIHALHDAPLAFLGEWVHQIPEPSIGFSMAYILVILVGTALLSLLYQKRKSPPVKK